MDTEYLKSPYVMASFITWALPLKIQKQNMRIPHGKEEHKHYE